MSPRVEAGPYITAAFVVLASGCGQPVPVQIRDSPGDAALVDDAFSLLGLEYEFSDRVRGTIYIALYDELDPESRGQTLRRARCYKAIVAERHPWVIAHEISHALGLDHCRATCEPGNLMYWEYSDYPKKEEWEDALELGAELNAGQLDELERGRRQLVSCR